MKRIPSPIRLLKERYFGEAARHPGVARKALADLSRKLPAEAVPVASEAVEQLIDYQDPDYALLYLDRLSRYVAPGAPKIDSATLANIARLMSARMQYEDPIRVARLKLAEAGGMQAIPDPASTPRIERYRWHEILTILPPAAAAPAIDFFARLRLMRFIDRSITIRFGYRTGSALRFLKGLAGLRVARPFSQRCKAEKAWVERWLHMIDRSLVRQPEATSAIVNTAQLISGHGDPYFEGIGKWNVIVDGLVKPTCDGALPMRTLAEAVREAEAVAAGEAGDKRVREKVEALRMQCIGRT